MRSCFLLLLIATLAVVVATPIHGEVIVEQCGAANECVCVTWISGSAASVEVRCPSGTTNPPPGGEVGSTLGGTGIPVGRVQPYPGNPLPQATQLALNSARQLADQRLQGEFDPELNRIVPNECTALFLESPLGRSGRSLLNGYVEFRSGDGVQDAPGQIPCERGAIAWTQCCSHSPYVFICTAAFERASRSQRSLVIIHELLHVGGQREDQNTTVGAGDPPNTAQISDAVAKACG